jgi:hypothetical protein
MRGNTRFISSVEHDISRGERSERVRYHVQHELFNTRCSTLYKGQSLKSDNFYREAIIEKR